MNLTRKVWPARAHMVPLSPPHRGLGRAGAGLTAQAIFLGHIFRENWEPVHQTVCHPEVDSEVSLLVLSSPLCMCSMS